MRVVIFRECLREFAPYPLGVSDLPPIEGKRTGYNATGGTVRACVVRAPQTITVTDENGAGSQSWAACPLVFPSRLRYGVMVGTDTRKAVQFVPSYRNLCYTWHDIKIRKNDGITAVVVFLFRAWQSLLCLIYPGCLYRPRFGCSSLFCRCFRRPRYYLNTSCPVP